MYLKFMFLKRGGGVDIFKQINNKCQNKFDIYSNPVSCPCHNYIIVALFYMKVCKELWKN